MGNGRDNGNDEPPPAGPDIGERARPVPPEKPAPRDAAPPERPPPPPPPPPEPRPATPDPAIKIERPDD